MWRLVRVFYPEEASAAQIDSEWHQKGMVPSNGGQIWWLE